jgi:Fe-S oxidoreductase
VQKVTREATVCGMFLDYVKFVGEFEKHWRNVIDEFRKEFTSNIIDIQYHIEIIKSNFDLRLAA